MLPLAKLQTAIADCEREVTWKPSYAGGILAIPLLDEGDAGGVAVIAHKQRRAYQGIALAVNETKRVQPGDLVCFDQGRVEELRTMAGELFIHTTEPMLAGLDEEFRPKEPTLQASGLWVPQ